MIACNASINANEVLSKEEYKETLARVAPYVIKKPDDIGYEERFAPASKPYYDQFINLTGGKLVYFSENDTCSLFMFEYRDLSSLQRHFRALGGYYRTDEKGGIAFMNILFHTPRLTRNEMDVRGQELFVEMTDTGGVVKFIGNRNFIDTPNADFYYNTKTNRWDYTENSSWKFLEEAKQAADSTATN